MSNYKWKPFFIGNGIDYMNLALQDGGVALTVKLGIGILDTKIKTDSVRFDDNEWHHILVSRESSKVNFGSSFYYSFFYKKKNFFHWNDFFPLFSCFYSMLNKHNENTILEKSWGGRPKIYIRSIKKRVGNL